VLVHVHILKTQTAVRFTNYNVFTYEGTERDRERKRWMLDDETELVATQSRAP